MYPAQPLVHLYGFNQVQSCGTLLSSAGENEDMSLTASINTNQDDLLVLSHLCFFFVFLARCGPF